MRHGRLLVAALLLATCGCMRIRQTLTLNEDGTALFELDYSIPEQTVLQLKAMRKLEADLAKAAGEKPPVHEGIGELFLDPNETAIRRELRAHEQHGIVVKQFGMTSREAARHIRLKIEAKDLAKLAEADFFKQHGFTLRRHAMGHYEFRRAGQAIQPTVVPDMPEAELVRLLTPILGGFSVELTVRTPGRVLATNASRKTLTSATWRFDFENDPDAMLRAYAQDLRIVFEGKGVELPTLSPTDSTSG